MKFIAKRGANLRLIIAPRGRMEVDGRLISTSLNPDFPAGLTVEFQNGIYETQDKAVIKALKAHKDFGMRFFTDEAGEAETPSNEALKAENEAAEYKEELRSTCPECGKKFKNEAGLEIHMRSHNKEE